MKTKSRPPRGLRWSGGLLPVEGRRAARGPVRAPTDAYVSANFPNTRKMAGAQEKFRTHRAQWHDLSGKNSAQGPT
jgi:hypothetical protein